MKAYKSMFPMMLVALASVPFLVAQRPMMPRYNAANETTLRGTVEEVRQIPHRNMTGIRLVIKTETGTETVALGPQSFLEQNNFMFAKGDQVEVTGAKIEFNGSRMVIAREIKKGDQTLALRDSQGIPKWARQRRGANAH